MNLMLLLLLAATRASSPEPPLVMFAVETGSAPATADEVSQALAASGRRGEDVTRDREAYRCGAQPCPWERGDFSAAIPQGFPRSAEARLRQAIEACSQLTRLGRALALSCGVGIQDALWTDWLNSHHARAYFEVRLTPDHRLISIHGYGLPGPHQVLQDDEATAPGAVSALVKRFVEEKGAVGTTHPAEPNWPVPATADELVLLGPALAAFTPVAMPNDCSWLPLIQGLPQGPFFYSLHARSLASLPKGKLPAKMLTCTVSPHAATAAHPSTVDLSCRDLLKVREVTPFQVTLKRSLDKPGEMERVTGELLSQILPWACHGAAPATVLPPIEATAPRPVPQPAPKAATKPWLACDWAGCMGTCPVFSFTIELDGSVVWNGGCYTPTPQGRHVGKMAAEDMERLRHAFADAHFLDWDGRYNGTMDDVSTATLTVTDEGRAKTVRHAVVKTPRLQELIGLESQLLGLAPIREWLGTEKDWRNSPCM